ncbi:hypothetical protein V6N11_034485 [Hibiscus sabdariffa]|uniref:Uncharacterized protein n=1 Tax=Hibiscus sabdariffa TaxID=183260 RepID=A0ABR2NEG5_9ROSI
MLRTAEGNMKKGGSKSVLMVCEVKGKGKGKKVAKSKGNGKTKPKGKEALKPKGGVSKDEKCFHCGKTGHWKRNCPIYLEDVKKAKAVGASVLGIYVIDVNMSTSSSWVLDTGCGSHICTSVQGLHTRRTLAKGDVDLRVGNGARVVALAARGGYQYFITFTDDFSRYRYIYLMRHKFEALEKFKEFKNEVQNKHGKSIKALRSDRGGEYLSQDFDELLKECGIFSQLTPPGTPQWNGVSERRNRTLLDMVRSMMSHTDLPTSFWGYALETVTFTLNRVPSKSVQKIPHEMWTGRCPNMSFMKIWGFKAYVKHQMSTKLEPGYWIDHANPGEGHWIAVKNILKYLRRTKDVFLVYGGEEELRIKGYTDTSFQTDKDDSRSQSGFVFCLNGGAVRWKSSKQDTVADSTTETEYIAASEAAKEAVWIKKFITELGVIPSIADVVDLYCDNNGAIAQAKEPKSH